MGQYFLTVTGSFEAGHFLPNYPGPCAQQHGHCWKVVAIWDGDELDPETGMCWDLRILKRALRNILDQYDHQNLNDFFAIPTAENIAVKIFERLRQCMTIGKYLVTIKVEETEGCIISYTGDPCLE